MAAERHRMAMASKPMLCRGCWEQMHVPVPIRGPLAPLARLLGIKRPEKAAIASEISSALRWGSAQSLTEPTP